MHRALLSPLPGPDKRKLMKILFASLLMATIWGCLGSIFCSFIAGLIATIWLNLWFETTVIPVAAFSFVLIGGITAPTHKLLCSLLLFCLASTIAAINIGESLHPSLYYPTYLPLITTLLAALAGVLGVTALGKGKEMKSK